jgi:hypothetical protein
LRSAPREPWRSSGSLGQPLTDAPGLALQLLDAPGLPGMQARLRIIHIGMPVAREHALHGGLHLLRLVLELGARAAALLGGVAGQLHAVDGKHLAPDQTLRVADQEHLLEHFANQLVQARDEGGDGGEVRAGVAAQGNEGDVLAARAFDGPAGDDATRVRQPHELEQHARRVGTRAGVVVVEARVEATEVDLVIEQVVQRMLERSGQQLRLKVHGQKARAGVDRLVAGHRGASVVAMRSPCNPRAARADSRDGFSTASLGHGNATNSEDSCLITSYSESATMRRARRFSSRHSNRSA